MHRCMTCVSLSCTDEQVMNIQEPKQLIHAHVIQTIAETPFIARKKTLAGSWYKPGLETLQRNGLGAHVEGSPS